MANQTEQKRFRVLPISFLQLKNFWIESARFETVSQTEALAPAQPTAVSFKAEYKHDEGKKEYWVRLHIRTRRAQTLPYNVSLVLVGLFECAEGCPKGEEDRLIAINAPAILYGIARGVISTLTALAPLGPMQLPSVNFVAAYKGNEAK